ncbi:MAG: hypothetical protein GEU90_20700 [Gemmatimonas sp.]|nr:hypothetical protein [Gemmatimonas sp.]
MKRVLLLLCASAIFPVALEAQDADAEIERALLAAPGRMGAEAMVLQLRSDGTADVLREGSNGLMCWDNVGRPGFDNPVDSQCTTEENRARLEQNHEFLAAGGSEEELEARFADAEADGTRAESVFGSIYYHVMGDSPEAIRTHTTVAVPGATGESLGLPESGGAGMLWLMEPGMTSAHLMVSGM